MRLPFHLKYTIILSSDIFLIDKVYYGQYLKKKLFVTVLFSLVSLRFFYLSFVLSSFIKMYKIVVLLSH